jgi:hypothetical protein
METSSFETSENLTGGFCAKSVKWIRHRRPEISVLIIKRVRFLEVMEIKIGKSFNFKK